MYVCIYIYIYVSLDWMYYCDISCDGIVHRGIPYTM